MRTPLAVSLLCAAMLALGSPPARAQQPAAPADIQTVISERHDVINEKDHHHVGKVEIEFRDAKLYADDVWLYRDEDRAVASGNVLFRQGSSQVTADRADFNTKTRLGVFHNAAGFAGIQPPRQPARPGAVPPASQDTTVYFFGDTVEKLGPKKYKIVNGGFTTCVQPTPRWDLHADTVVLNIDHYTLLRQAVLTVKGVPLLYVPVLYYPTKRGDRATGVLLPTYGMSSLRGQSFHNAFFWAMNRSHDATFMHDWFSKTGQGTGGEYRYNFGGGSEGAVRAYMLDQHETTYARPDGLPTVLPASRSYELRGGASQTLPAGLRARGRVDYFSSITTVQTFNTNVNDASRSQRNFGGNVIGTWGTYTLNGTFDHNEYFYNQSTSGITGSAPRVALTRNERPLPNTPFYFSVGSEYARILSTNKSGTTEVDRTLTRLDVNPQIRFPFRRWQWFTVNTTASWRKTYYTRSVDTSGVVSDDAVSRRLVTLQTQLTGPVLHRIWDTPGNGYAEKVKHSIEPYLNIRRTSSIDNFDRIVLLEGVDAIVGGVTQLTYGVTNRVFAKRRGEPGQASMPREIVEVDLQQTYYTDDRAAQFDRQYATSFTGTAPNHYSPIALNVRATPTTDINATVRAEFDSRYHSLRTISASGAYSWSSRVQTSVGWSKKAFIPKLAGFDDPELLDHYLNASSNVRTRDNRFGGAYAFNYDVLRGTILQQRMSGYYNAQCCGIAFEYQIYNFATIGSPLPSDRRFFLSFTLAGLGNFSPFNGALGGIPR